MAKETTTATLVGKIQDQGLELRKAQQQLAQIRYLVTNVASAYQILSKTRHREVLDHIGEIADGKIVDYSEGK